MWNGPARASGELPADNMKHAVQTDLLADRQACLCVFVVKHRGPYYFALCLHMLINEIEDAFTQQKYDSRQYHRAHDPFSKSLFQLVPLLSEQFLFSLRTRVRFPKSVNAWKEEFREGGTLISVLYRWRLSVLGIRPLIDGCRRRGSYRLLFVSVRLHIWHCLEQRLNEIHR